MANITKSFSKILLALIVTISTACTPEGSNSGRVEFEVIVVSDQGIEGNLNNGTAKTIRVRGEPKASASAELWPDDAAMECRAAADSTWTEEPFSISHSIDQPKTIELDSRKQLRLLIANTTPLRFKGGTCRVRLRLAGETYVESKEFHP